MAQKRQGRLDGAAEIIPGAGQGFGDTLEPADAKHGGLVPGLERGEGLAAAFLECLYLKGRLVTGGAPVMKVSALRNEFHLGAQRPNETFQRSDFPARAGPDHLF